MNRQVVRWLALVALLRFGVAHAHDAIEELEVASVSCRYWSPWTPAAG